MKRKQCWLPALLVSIACSCARPEANLDVNLVESSAREHHLQSRLALGVVSSADPATDKRCSLFNERIDAFISGLRDSLLADTAATPRELWVSDTLFRATDRYISARLTVYTYSGGAHGMTRFHAFNYDTCEQEFIDNARLLDYTRKAEIEKLLKVRLDNKDGRFTVDPVLTPSTVINFSAGEMIFTYPPYALGPYSSGAAEIIVPLEALGKAVKPRL
ncbi:MAG: DUF3298 and DUF4163 domain-containing protein [Odoribacteraceae bacterium]|jgi:hypothetical protein|nr:DUF3298 and DUF4163 domain-containing protein [Odoribacteraceae bacterium]